MRLQHAPPFTLSSEGLFRYFVVSEIRTRLLRGQPLVVAIAEVLDLPHHDIRGRPREVSERTLYRWHAAFTRGGAAALEPVPPARLATAIPGNLLAYIRIEKCSDPEASLPELLKRARGVGILREDERVHRSTLWRTCRRLGIALTRTRRLAQTDMRRFAYPHRMMMVLCDGKHFRAGTTRVRRVALLFIDDATRFLLDVIVGTDESSELFLRGLHSVIRRHGLMDGLYLDQGPGFIADDTASALANLDIPLIFGKVRFPEGHGKIEAFNRRIKAQLLRSFDGNPEIDPDVGALRLRILHWIETDYNRSHHEGIATMPEAAWLADDKPLRFPEDDDWLDSRFAVTFIRTVTKANTVPYESVDYEVPIGHSQTRITVTRRLLDGALMVMHQGKLVRIHPVDLVANAYAGRGRLPEPTRAEGPVTTAADLAFKADFPPLVDEDGGYIDRGDDTDEDPDR
jgi:transposase InsO family protein